MEKIDAFVRLDVHKETVSIAISEAERGGEVRHVGTIANSPEAIAKMARRFKHKYQTLEFVYEAGRCGYRIQRQLTELGFTWGSQFCSQLARRTG